MKRYMCVEELDKEGEILASRKKWGGQDGIGIRI